MSKNVTDIVRESFLEPKGFWSWLMSVDHKRIGIMYLITGLLAFLVGGVFALLIRTELIAPGHTIVDKDAYNIIFTLHGVIMIFIFIVPGIIASFGNILLPIMIGAKDVAFPKLNRFSFHIYLVGIVIAAIGFINPIDTGWTFYTPYSAKTGTGVIIMATSAFVLGFSSILTGLNFIVTIHKLRAKGMTWYRMPLFCWSTYSGAIIQVVATPVIGITLLLLLLEKFFGVGFFNPDLGGDPMLFQHFFWFYSHPVVYIMILPAMGVVSEIIPAFSRKPIFGYKAIAWSSIAIAGISFLVWGHHLFVANESTSIGIVFAFLTYIVAVPTAIKVFNWMATLYKGEITLSSPMLYALGFIVLFIIGGLTGLPLGAVALDVPLHDTYFIVAHFHYTIQGGTVIGLMAALHYWFPKISGRMYNEKWAVISFIIVFFSFHFTFIPQFIMGISGLGYGLTRRYYDYDPKFHIFHLLSSIGAYSLAIGYCSGLLNLVYSAYKGKKAGANPWNARGLEWTIPSPPPHENFKKDVVVKDWPYDYDKM